MNDAVGGFPAERADWTVVVHPWTYNPSAWRQRVPIAGLAMVAFFLAVHLALYQWRLIGGVWDPVFGEQSEAVLDSNLSHWMRNLIGIPDAALGAVAYLGDAVFGLAGSTRRWQYRPWLVILFGIDVIPLGIVSAALVLCQFLVVGNWCFLCLVTAAISLALVYLAYDEVFSSLIYLWRVWRRTSSARQVWRALWGRPSPIGNQIAAEMIR